jgi:molybdate transport system substrate-binding protein
MMTALGRGIPALLLLGLAACGGEAAGSGAGRGAEPADTLLVDAASDLQAAFAELVPRYEAASGVRVQVAFGSTGNLTTQIENGAPADLFFAASESYLDRLAAAGLIDPGTRRVYARGRLALVWDSTVHAPASVAELARPEYRTVAIANPEHAPYGMAAREALQAAGAWDRVRRRLVLGENISQTYQFVRTGNAEAGIVALSLVVGGEPRAHLLIPDSLHAPLLQAAVVLKASRHAAAARAFLDFVVGAEGQALLRRYGFERP